MTYVFDNPADFKSDVIAGFAAAYARYATQVPRTSGFIRAAGPLERKVSLVVGGGSGHYPSYAGLVGPGLADGCVLGDVFTSPSAEQVYRVARAAASDAGVVLSFGNYAGDRLNFAAAAERLEAEGVNTRIVYVTDDIASASRAEHDKRRGIAGTAAVYKIGGAVAESGDDLDGVERVMRAANDATFSFGVAFEGCTLPGQHQPLFGVKPGQMDLGLGIHGEPGIESVDLAPAAELARTLLEPLLKERPAGADGRVALIVNGLGATKYDELFVLYAHVDRLLREAGVQPVLPEVGEFVTSLDMAGCSVSLTWLDDELEQHWTAPVDTAAFRRGNLAGHFPAFRPAAGRGADPQDQRQVPEGNPASQANARIVRNAVDAMTEAMIDNEDELGRIDAVAGDGDHGTGMVRGLRAAREAVHADDLSTAGCGSVLSAAAEEFGDKAGGTSGILWAILLSSLGRSFGDHEPVDGAHLVSALRDAAATLGRIGKAEPGDKTMLDALLPFIETLGAKIHSGEPISAAWSAAAADAHQAAEATATLRPKIGRARPLAERSIGSPDAGAISMAMIVTAVSHVLNRDCP